MTKLSRWLRVPSRLVFTGLLLAGLAFLVANCARLWIFTADDAYITFRYAANVASGMGPTFNQQPRAEGYTSVLWMVIMVIPHLLRFGVISFAKLLGVLSAAGTMAVMALFVWQAGRVENRAYRLAAAGMACLFFGLLPETAVHAVSGMETAGYTFLLAGLALLAYLAIKGSRRALDWLPLAALLAGLMRPEANLPAVLALAAAAFCLWRGERAALRRFIFRSFLLYILPGLAYFLWRWSYFGILLPLPFYAKTSVVGLPGLGMASAFGLFALANLGLYLALGLFGERRAVNLLLLLALPDLGFFLFSAPIMAYDYRFFFPLLPLLLVLAGMGLELLLAQASGIIGANRGPRRAWLAPAWVGLIALAVFAGQNLPRAGALFENKRDYALGMLRSHVTIGQTLAQVPHDQNDPVLVVSDAGAMPYFSGWRTVDIGGLNDPNITLGRVPLESYLTAQHPDVMVLTSNDPQEYRSEYGRTYYDLALKQGLEVVARSPFYRGDSLWVLARPGSPAAELLQARFAP